MKKFEFTYPSADKKTTIHGVEWLPDSAPKAILIIAHGVTEHILRYEEFAEFFTERGIAVAGNDHLGHGTSIAPGAEPMYFGPEGSWKLVVQDLHTCREYLKTQFPDIPCYMLGFSLGSFLLRTYLIQYPRCADAALLLGTGQTPAFQIAAARFLAKKEAKKAGESHSTPAIKKLTFGTYNKIFAPNRTEFDWLCADEKSLDAYISDPLRGEALSCGLFREMLNGMAFTGKLKNQKKMNPNLPVLFLSGGRDPVGGCGKGVTKAYESFRKAGMKHVALKLYPGLRHDVLHEGCRREIFEYIWFWIEQLLP